MIPKILHFVWIGPDMPARYLAWCEAWMRIHPTWDVVLWDEHSHGVPGSCCHDRQRSNWMRLHILREHGGVYVDCDTEPLKNVEQLIAGHDACASPFNFTAKTQTTTVCNSFIAAAPGHPWIVECCELLAKADPSEHLSMGSSLISDSLKRHPDVTVLPRGSIMQWPGWEKLGRRPPADCYAVHHFDNMKKPRAKWAS